jgi:HSP20 family protein
MSLIRWQPLRELDALRQQINRLFDEMIHSDREFNLLPKSGDIGWMPAIELKETDEALILKAEVPGIDTKDLDVQASETMVSIAGEHQEEKHSEEKGIFRSELRYGKFQRTVPLPVSIKTDQIKPEFKDGVLTLTLPKAESARQNVVKVDVTMQEQAREAVTQERQHDEQLQEKMHTRTAAELQTPADNSIAEKARELMAEQRQWDEHLQETAHTRAADEIGTSVSR